MKHYITIFSPKMAGYLIDHGCLLLHKRPDLVRPCRAVSSVQDSAALRDLMNNDSGGR